MYINSIEIRDFRTFEKFVEPVSFVHPDRSFGVKGDFPSAKLKNINLLLGDNGSGKTSMLKAIALAALGPAVGDSGIYPYELIRIGATAKSSPNESVIEAEFKTHPQDQNSNEMIYSRIGIEKKGDLERMSWEGECEDPWHPVFSEATDAMFVVGYGANRRIEKSERYKSSSRSSERAKRIMSLFDEDYALRPLNTWLPELKQKKSRKRYDEVVKILDELLGQSSFRFTGKRDSSGEFLFDQRGAMIPLPALSDGYRAYLGWIGDLLYHVTNTCPPKASIKENCGIVMIDEVDLHLHPKWQMKVLPDLAKALPKVQFIATSHSPLVVGSLEWMNVYLMKRSPSKGVTKVTRVQKGIHGLDADQLLLTELFGLRTTRSGGRSAEITRLRRKAAQGDEASARLLLEKLISGKEASK